MKETIEEYKKRILGYQAGKDPLKLQAATPGKLDKLLKGVARGKLTRRPAPGKWSVAEIIAHLADDELVGGYRVRKILEAPGTTIEAFDQDKWAEAGKYVKRNPKESLELFRALRNANLALLRSLDTSQWGLTGLHAERGAESIERYAQMYAGHDINHLQQIEVILGKTGRR